MDSDTRVTKEIVDSVRRRKEKALKALEAANRAYRSVCTDLDEVESEFYRQTGDVRTIEVAVAGGSDRLQAGIKAELKEDGLAMIKLLSVDHLRYNHGGGSTYRAEVAVRPWDERDDVLWGLS